MVALTFNDLRTEQKETGRAQGTEHNPAQQGSNSVAQGRARQLSKGISPPFKTCLGSSKERTIFFYVMRTYCIVFITGLQLIWCLLLFCCCSAPVLLAASRLGQRQSQASLQQPSQASTGAGHFGVHLCANHVLSQNSLPALGRVQGSSKA